MSGGGKSSEERWKELNITKSEVDRIGEALKDEKFRKLFTEYAEELSDPKNRELYEQEIAQMEADRGMDVQFVHPKPGHVLKAQTKPLKETQLVKTFINICQNELIGKPSCEKKVQPNGKAGVQWSIPHSFSPARDDLDKKGEKCVVYDVVFHPDTLKMASNPSYLKMVHDTVTEGLERQFGIEIDRKTVVHMKNLKFKGTAQPTVMRTKKKESNGNNDSSSDKENQAEDPLAKFPYPYKDNVSSAELAETKAKQVAEEKEKLKEAEKRRKEHRKKASSTKEEKELDDGVVIPQYTVTNQYGVDMTDFAQSTTGTLMHGPNAPTSLLISISLPALSSAKPCNLDVTERLLSLETSEPVKYKLDLKLPYPVDDVAGSAKFDKAKKQLNVTLPVKRRQLAQQIDKAIRSHTQMDTDTTRDTTAAGDVAANVNVTADEERPMIEVISSHDSMSSDVSSVVTNPVPLEEVTDVVNDNAAITPTSPHQSPGNEENTSQSSSVSPIVLDEKVMYRLPALTFDQDEESVTLVVDVPRVDVKSLLSTVLPEQSQMEVLFTTTSPTGFVTHYYIKSTFPGSVSDMSHSVGERNVVLTINKSQPCLWESFTIQSTDDNSSQTHEFLTQSHIEQEIAQLEELAKQEVFVSSTGSEKKKPAATSDELVVNEMNAKHLSIDIKATEDGVSRSKLTSPEVIHKHSPPANIHGILKRSHSESTADESSIMIQTLPAGVEQVPSPSDSSTSPGDQPIQPFVRERKKSVSFSEKVEEAKFKSKDSVCQMHKTLVNRRKKKRQRENRKFEGANDGRRRRNSSNSEYSSSDEVISGRNHQGGRRRRHSSSASDEGHTSPRSPRNNNSIVSSAEENEIEDESTCTCNSEKHQQEQNGVTNEPELLNSDDDELVEEGEDLTDSLSKNSTNDWKETNEYVEKTKCAFDFENSMIFDLDE